MIRAKLVRRGPRVQPVLRAPRVKPDRKARRGDKVCRAFKVRKDLPVQLGPKGRRVILVSPLPQGGSASLGNPLRALISVAV